MVKLMWLEWKKLKRHTVISEIIIYMLILMIMPVFFIKAVMPAFGESYASAIELNFYIQMGFVLFGGSLINQVFIEEYKHKTIALSFGYPISRKKLFMAKILFIALCIFVVTVISYILTGVVTYTIDQFFPFINGQPTNSDLQSFFGTIITNSFIVTLISFVPLFFFGIWLRGTVLTVICSMVMMQLPNFSSFLHLKPEPIVISMCLIGALSIFLSIKTVEYVGEI